MSTYHRRTGALGVRSKYVGCGSTTAASAGGQDATILPTYHYRAGASRLIANNQIPRRYRDGQGAVAADTVVRRRRPDASGAIYTRTVGVRHSWTAGLTDGIAAVESPSAANKRQSAVHSHDVPGRRNTNVRISDAGLRKRHSNADSEEVPSGRNTNVRIADAGLRERHSNADSDEVPNGRNTNVRISDAGLRITRYSGADAVPCGQKPDEDGAPQRRRRDAPTTSEAETSGRMRESSAGERSDATRAGGQDPVGSTVESRLPPSAPRRRPPSTAAVGDHAEESAAFAARRQRLIRRTTSSPEMSSAAAAPPVRRRLPGSRPTDQRESGGLVSTHDQFLQVCVRLNEVRFHELVNRVRLMGSKTATVNQTDISGRTPLSHLCGHSNGSCVQNFARLKNIYPNLADRDGNAPLHYAAQAGNAAVVTALLEHFPDIVVDVKNRQGFTPLHKACIQGKSKCAKLLLDKGADPELRDAGRSLTCVEWAYFCGRAGCARLVECHLLAMAAPGAAAAAVFAARLKRHSSAPDVARAAAAACGGRLAAQLRQLLSCVRPLPVRWCSVDQLVTDPGSCAAPQLPPRQRSRPPTIRVQQVEVPVDPFLARYGDPVAPPQQRSTLLGQVGTQRSTIW